MQTGIIAGLTQKGFGFIKIEGQQKDLFFHSNELEKTLETPNFEALNLGDTLSFEVEQGDKGPKAVRVSRIAKAVA